MKRIFQFMGIDFDNAQETQPNNPEVNNDIPKDNELHIDKINARNSKGKTALMKAIENENLKLINYLLSLERLNINLVDNSGNSALHYAVVKTNPNILIQLLNKNADPDQANKRGHTALHDAIACKLDRNALVLIDKKANIDCENQAKETPLLLACKNNLTMLAIKILALNADCNVKDRSGNTPLICAARHGNVDLIRALENHGVDLMGEEAEMAIKEALLNNQINALKTLIELGITPYVHVYPQSDSLISGLGKLSSSSHEGKDRTRVLQNGDTPLHFAVRTDDLELAALCLSKKSSLVNSMNEHGKTPAHLAVKYLSPVMANLLFTKGSEISQGISVSSLWGGSRFNTLLMQGASKEFASADDIERFFSDPNYQLSPEQLELRSQNQQKDVLKNVKTVSFSKVNTIFGSKYEIDKKISVAQEPIAPEPVEPIHDLAFRG